MGMVARHPRWLFQAKPEKYDLQSEFIEGRSEDWYQVPHWNKPYRIGEDQTVIFFRAGSREFYGVGEVLSVSSCILEGDNHTSKKGVDVSYRKRFNPPIAIPQSIPNMKWDSGKLPLLFTKGFQGTLFPLSDNDWSNLTEICPRLRSEL
jgi:hypothetical protein